MDRVQIRAEKNSVLVSGEISFVSAVTLWKESLKILSSLPKWEFDFSAVNFCNSAGLALILEWLKLAKQQKKMIQFEHVPQQLRAMAAAAGLDRLLGEYILE